MKPQAVVLYLQNQFGNVLTITRKDDHNSFGLVGGKVDSTDNTPRDALNREVFEETLNRTCIILMTVLPSILLLFKEIRHDRNFFSCCFKTTETFSTSNPIVWQTI